MSIQKQNASPRKMNLVRNNQKFIKKKINEASLSESQPRVDTDRESNYNQEITLPIDYEQKLSIEPSHLHHFRRVK